MADANTVKIGITAAERVKIARHAGRPNASDYISALFTDFFEQKGDRNCRDDESIIGGTALFHGLPITVIAHHKGKDINENLKYNFGMAGPEGYRKAQRLMKQAEKFSRPVITFIDTPGAYPGLEAEARGQGEAIARSLAMMSSLKVPIIAVITGEGNSGGALALGVADSVLMLQNATYSILSPEGFASILWRDSSRADEAAENMKLTAPELLKMGIIDEIIAEPENGAHEDHCYVIRRMDEALIKHINKLRRLNTAALVGSRYKKFRVMGNLPS